MYNNIIPLRAKKQHIYLPTANTLTWGKCNIVYSKILKVQKQNKLDKLVVDNGTKGLK